MRALYICARFLFKVIAKLSGCRFRGRENLVPGERYIYVANHTSFCDPIMLACAVPEQVHFVAKAEFARNVFLRRLFTALGVLFVKREEADISALRRAMTFLNYNKSLGIFPEGKRHYDGIMGEFKPGFAFIAYKSDAKVVPVAIIESRYFFNFLRRSKKVIIGKPQSIVKGDMENSAFLVHHSNKVREAIAIMLNEYS